MRRRSNGFCFELFSVEKLKFFVIAMLALLCVACGGAPVAEDQTDVTVLLDTPTEIKLEASNAPTSWVVEIPTHGDLSGEAPDLLYSPEIGYVGPDSFTFKATNAKGTSTPATVSINVVSGIVEDAVIESFSASSLDVIEGSSATLEWTTLNADTVEITPGIGQVDLSGSIDVTPFQTITYTLIAQNSANTVEQSLSITVYPNDPGLPQDPGEIAPVIDSREVDFSDEISFLYEGNNPIQVGVVVSEIDSDRAGVIRGKVLGKDNAPISGVVISIVGFPEFGHSKTREDGVFDMVVNGGNLYTIQYEKVGLLAVQRQLDMPLRDYSWVRDAVMIPVDSKATTVSLGFGEMQIAQGTPIFDDRGTRQATIVFPEGTTAQKISASGVATNLAGNITVRATEYTVGENGYDTMPGELPPSSAYTYAVELSVDEVVTAPGERIEFSKALPVYVDNFLGFPVGVAVPSGWYDAEKNAWIASDDGRVIEVLSVEGGKAAIDIDGSGVAAEGSALVALGVSEAELVKLADLYSVGSSLWRVPVTHFTPWDFNYPIKPYVGDIDFPEVRTNKKITDSNCLNGSIVECENQVIREIVPIAGTGITLNYSSDRVVGYSAGREVEFILTGEDVPDQLVDVQLRIVIAGQIHTEIFPGAPNIKSKFVWDGKDAYGREVWGDYNLSYIVTNRYVTNYYAMSPEEAGRSFGSPEGLIEGPETILSFVSAADTFPVSSFGAKDLYGLGGWSLSEQHFYSPKERSLYLGNGQKVDSKAVRNTIKTIAGNGIELSSGSIDDDTVGLDSAINPAYGIAVDSDGGVYFSDLINKKVMKLSAYGLLYTIAGNGGVYDVTVDINGKDAKDVALAGPAGLALDSAGNLYIADGDSIRKVDRFGKIFTIAGGGGVVRADGIPAVEAQLVGVFDVAVARDGTVYANEGNVPFVILLGIAPRVFKVTPDGMIITVAGGHLDFVTPISEGEYATSGFLSTNAIALGPDDKLYIADATNECIWLIDSSGRLDKIAGNGENTGTVSEGVVTDETSIPVVVSLTVAKNGTVFMATVGYVVALEKKSYFYWDNTGAGPPILVTGYNWVQTIVAGVGVEDEVLFNGDGLPLKETVIFPFRMDLNSEGSLYFFDALSYRIRKIFNPLPSTIIGETEYLIPSTDASVIYVFNKYGRHLETRDSLTDEPLLTFGYSDDGYIVWIKDENDNLVEIERSGKIPSKITAPFEQSTTLIPDVNGYLQDVIYADESSYNFQYFDGGLLKNFTNPNSQTSTIDYFDNGKLKYDESAHKSAWTLSSKNIANGYEVEVTTALNRKRTHKVQKTTLGGIKKTLTQFNGAVSVTTEDVDGGRTVQSSNGMLTQTSLGPDPRFGMKSPFTRVVSVSTPSGKSRTVTRNKSVTYSVGSLVETLSSTSTTNGLTHSSVYYSDTNSIVSTTPEARVSTVYLDEKQRVSEVNVPGMYPVFYKYDGLGRLYESCMGEAEFARCQTIDFNLDTGFLEKITFPNGSWAQNKEFDLLGRSKETLFDDDSVIGYDFDYMGNVTEVTPPEKPAHTMGFSDLNSVEDSVAPDIGGAGRITHYEWDLDKNIKWIDRADGTRINYTYDPVTGELDNVAWEGLSFAFDYYETSRQLKSIESPYGVGLTFFYDGSLAKGDSWSGDIVGSVEPVYTEDLRMDSINVNGIGIGYLFDDDGLLTNAGDMELLPDEGNGILRGTTLGSIQTNQDPNEFGEIKYFEVKNGPATLYSYDITKWDKLGRIVDKTEFIEGASTTFHYDYDLADRLWKVTINGSLVREYGYDDNGNRDRLDGSVIGSYDNQDRLNSYDGATYAYTDNGELKSKTVGVNVTQYTYDAFNNLTYVKLPDGKEIDYIIDGKGRRVGKKVGGVKIQGFLYSGALNIVAELDASNAVVSRFVYADKGSVPSYMVKGGANYRIVSDQVGSVRLVVHSVTGDVVQRIDYDEFGNVVSDSNPGFQPFGFAGGIYDADTNLVRFGVRDYDSEIGRWTAKDPILFDGGQTNLYAYVNNDPVNLIDPTGLSGNCSRFGDYEYHDVPYVYPYSDTGNLGNATPLLDLLPVGWLLKARVVQAVVTKTGWKVGDDVYNLTAKGNSPSWTTVRTRFWKNQAAAPGAAKKYGAGNLERMGKGRAPQRYNADKGGIESMELSHEPIPFRDG
ncbi:MAG: hypothetical protein JKX76_03115, partial [Colwellia sp.]|nr:hypothetical protein [Colwellia sp.]